MQTGYEHMTTGQLHEMLGRYKNQAYDNNKGGYGVNGMNTEYRDRVMAGVRSELRARKAREERAQNSGSVTDSSVPTPFNPHRKG